MALTRVREASVETGYDASDYAATEWEREGYGDRDADRESLPYVTEDDLPLGSEESDYADEGEFLAAIVAGYRY